MSYASENTFEGKNIVTTTVAAVTGALDVRKYRQFVFNISGLSGGETISLDISFDGAVWFSGMMPTVLTTNANAASTALVVGTYSFGGAAMPAAFVRLTKSAAVNSVTVAYGFRN